MSDAEQKLLLAASGLVLLAQPLIIFLMKRGLDALREVRDHLAKQNGRIGKVETKQERAEEDRKAMDSKLEKLTNLQYQQLGAMGVGGNPWPQHDR